MRSKAAVIVSLLAVLAIGVAALVVNTRILNTSPQPDIGRANEVLVPANAEPTQVTKPTSTFAPAPPAVAPSAPAARNEYGDDDGHADDSSDRDSGGHIDEHDD